MSKGGFAKGGPQSWQTGYGALQDSPPSSPRQPRTEIGARCASLAGSNALANDRQLANMQRVPDGCV